jgi:uncharacterized protein YggT (Ycf19 family)
MAKQPQSDSKAENQPAAYLRISRIIITLLYAWTIFGIIVLSLRFFLLMFSANTGVPFVTFIYETSDSFLAPFRGIFPAREFGATGYVDVSALFAIIIYLLIAWGVSSLIKWVDHKISISIESDSPEGKS